MVSALIPYVAIAAILTVMVMAFPLVGVLATASAVAVLLGGYRKGRR